MALIGKIRRNPWILIVMIALGLGGFLLMDTMSSGPGGGSSAQLILGEIDGEKVDRQEFEGVYSLLYRNSTGNPYANRGQLWNWYIEERLLAEEAEELGLGVSGAELKELEFGNNPSPIIAQRFSNPQTGQLDRQQLSNLQSIIEGGQIQTAIDNQQIGPTFVPYWQHQRKEIRKERIQSKLTNLVTKAMYVPTWMAEMGFIDQNQFLDFAYVKVPYDEIANEDVSVSDDDLSSYLQENKARFDRPVETRRLSYAVFNVAPTAADSADIRDTLVTDIARWRSERNDSSFVLANEGSISEAYFTQENLSPAIADTVFNLSVGSIYGPYVDGGAYRAVKVRDRQSMADSVQFRHILIGANSPLQLPQAEKTTDSLLTLLNNGAAFDTLVTRFSQDPTSVPNGGVYEGVVPGQFTNELNQVLFVTGTPGRYQKVSAPYGYHIVELQSRSATTTPRVKLAYLVEAIVPSKETQDNVYEQASTFAAENRVLSEMREAAAGLPNVQIENTDPLLKSGFEIGALGYGNDTRQMVCWAFSADEGDVSPDVYTFTDENAYYDNKYVVIALSDIVPEGLPEVDDIRDELMAAVMNDKKADMLKAQINSTDLNALAQQFSTQVDSVSNASFAQGFINGLGNEPAVLAMASKMDMGQTSQPIQGNTGVFVVNLIRKPTMGAPTNIPQVRQQMSATDRGPVAQTLIPFMVKNADIEDNRSRFDCASF